ncbi:MAG: lipoate--protein ligase family protein [Myxococcota bacterium]
MPQVQAQLPVTHAAFPGQAALDTAFSRALLREASQVGGVQSLRVYRPDEVLAFSSLDRGATGFAEALCAARALGFAAVLRLAGGRAALFHRDSLAFAWCQPSVDPRRGIEARYLEISDILVRALRALGVDAGVGEVPGEYCPGRYSVNARGRVKLAGVGQRVVRGAAYVGGVLLVDDAARAREALLPVYRALGLPLDPESIGSVAEEVEGLSLQSVLGALREEFARRYEVLDFEPSPRTLAAARELAPAHELGPGGSDASSREAASGLSA